ncbi:MAG: hypothetical protein K5841_07820 [Fretibacterium sp.]|nr:hypothetical protein [Fretibacterium sp.]
MAQEESANRFDPVRTKLDKSSTKRIALFIFVSAGVLFTLVTMAILNSGDEIVGSRAPSEVIEASRSASIVIPPPPRQTEPAPTPAVTPVQPEPSRQKTQPTPPPPPEPETPQPEVRRMVRPAYVPSQTRDMGHSVTDRRRESQLQRLQAASSPTAIQGFGPSSRQPQGQQTALQNDLSAAQGATLPAQQGAAGTMGLMPDAGDVTGSSNDPNGWARKEAFRQRALPAEYSQHTRAFPVSALELKAGAVLPCVLISGLNSDLPGNLIGQVSENVWDTATGRYLLIPRGSRLIGTYDNQISYGQNRALVVWSRLIFPDGSSLLLDNLQGADQAGYTGFKQRVDKHWGSMITSALLVSLLGAGVELAAPDNNNNNNNNSNRKDVGGILSERVASAIAEAMTQIISKGMNRQPTITVRPGYRFTIFVQHDIIFPRVWNSSQGR